MKEMKRRLELYSFYDHTGLERHLERMARKGWRLEKIWNNIWYYRRTRPRELKFSVTYFPEVSELDPEPWGARQVYELTYQDGSGFSNWYLLCYPDRIVEIWFSWELTEEQMRIVGEKLG